MKRTLGFATLFILLAVFLAACNVSLAQDVTPPPGYRPPAVQQTEVEPVDLSSVAPLVAPDPTIGETIYPEKCAPCHGVSGQGDGPQAGSLPNPVPALGSAELARQSAPAEWYLMVTQGNLESFMPPFNSLSDSERWGVVAYAYSLSFSPEVLAEGRRLFEANCASCHGPEGAGDGPEAAALERPPSDIADPAFMAQKTGQDFYTAIAGGVPPAMPAFPEFTDAELWALSDYVRALSFAEREKTIAAETLGPSASQTAAAEGAAGAQETAGPESATSEPEGTPVAEAPETASAGVIRGVVTNGSNGLASAGLTVTLEGFDDMQRVVTETVETGSDGTFAFEGVDMPAGRAFRTTVEYGGTTYASGFGVIEQEMTELELPLEVYESTTDASGLSGDRLHLFFDFVDENTLRVIQLFVLSNPSGKTIVPPAEGEPTLTFALPAGATNLEFQSGVLGGRFMETTVEGQPGFGDRAPIPPGQSSYQVLFAFEMPYDRKLDLAQPLTVPVNAVVILAPEGAINVRADGLQDGGVQDVEGVAYHMYNLAGLERGDTLSLTVTGRPSSGSPALSLGDNSSLIIGLAAFGVVLIGAGVWLFVRNRETNGVEAELDELSVAQENVANGGAEAIMDAILALDDLYEAGELPEEAYQQRRTELKARLKEALG